MSTRMLDVTCGDQCKRMRVKVEPLNDFKRTLRKEFDLRDDQDLTIKGTLAGKENEYDITTDGNLEVLLNDELVKLHIITREEQQISYIRDGVSYRLDEPMSEDDQLVVKYVGLYHLDDFINELDAMPAVIGISYIATVRACGESTLIDELNNIGLTTLRMLGKARLLMSGYQQTSSEVLHTFQRAIMSMFKNKEEEALEELSTVKVFVDQSLEDTKNVIAHVEEVTREINTFTTKKSQKIALAHAEKLKNERKLKKNERQLSQENKKHEQIKTAIGSINQREDVRKGKDADAGKKATVAAKLTVVSGVGLGAGGGILATASAMAISSAVPFVGMGLLIASPLFMMGSRMAYKNYKSKQKGLELEGKTNTEELEHLEREKVTVVEKQSDLEDMLEELSHDVGESHNLIRCLQDACNHTKNINVGLAALEAGWLGMDKLFSDIERREDVIEKKLNKAAAVRDTVKTDGFQCQVVEYYARWVALKVFATRCKESLDRAAKTLKYRLQTNTQQEAAEQFQAALECPNVLQLTYPTQDLEQGDQAESEQKIGRTHGQVLDQ